MLEFIHHNLRWVCRLKRRAGLIYQSEGSTAVEYSIMLALVVGGLLASTQAVGSGTNSLFKMVSSELSSVGSSDGGLDEGMPPSGRTASYAMSGATRD